MWRVDVVEGLMREEEVRKEEMRCCCYLLFPGCWRWTRSFDPVSGGGGGWGSVLGKRREKGLILTRVNGRVSSWWPVTETGERKNGRPRNEQTMWLWWVWKRKRGSTLWQVEVREKKGVRETTWVRDCKRERERERQAFNEWKGRKKGMGEKGGGGELGPSFNRVGYIFIPRPELERRVTFLLFPRPNLLSFSLSYSFLSLLTRSKKSNPDLNELVGYVYVTTSTSHQEKKFKITAFHPLLLPALTFHPPSHPHPPPPSSSGEDNDRKNEMESEILETASALGFHVFDDHS